MNNRLMISVAVAALMAGTGLANAQGTGTSREAPAAQQSAPAAERGAPAGEMNRDAAKPEMKSTQTEEKSPAAGKSQRADEGMQGPKSKAMSSDEKQGMKPNSMSSENDKAGPRDMDKTGNKDMKAEGRQEHNGNMNADSKGGAENKTVGQAGAGGKMTTEQRTKVTTVIREQHIQPIANVNFAISVGTRVPRDVSFHPLPTEIVSVYPDWRGYEFILVGNQIVVVDPQSFEIVAVIDA